MHRFFPIVLLLLFVFGSAPAMCQNTSELLTNKGVLGYWFPMETGDKLLKDVTELKLLREKVQLMDSKFEAQGDLFELMKSDIQVSEGIGEKWKIAFEGQIKVTQAQQTSYEAQLEALKKWYRSPVLWFSVGVVLTAAMAIGLNFGLAEAHQ